jgi:hypothetical protein
MAEQKRKLKGIADLYSIEDARRASAIVPEAISTQTIPTQSIPTETIPKKNTPRQSKKPTTIPTETIVRETIPRKNAVNTNHGYYPVYNDLSDRLIPELKLRPHEQAILQRLYRLSRGWKSKECVVGLGALSKFCVMSRSQVQRSLATLIEMKLIEDLGEEKRGGREGKRYRVLPEMPSIPGGTIPRESIVPEGTSIPTQNTVVCVGIPTQTTIKYSNKDLNTYTHTEGVGVGSKFSLEACREYADNLSTTGQGINNPGGFAMSIYRSGVADAFIEKFLNPVAEANPPEVNACPDCKGTGFFYPQGSEHGVARCKHERLMPHTGSESRLTGEEITEHSSLIAELLASGYTLEQAKEQFGGGMHTEDWQLILAKIEQDRRNG